MKTYRTHIIAAACLAALAAPGCATVRKVLALEPTTNGPGPIHNPFGAYYSGAPNELGPPMVLRTKKGDRAVEVEIPRGGQDVSDFVIPLNPSFRDGQGGRGGYGGRSPASTAAIGADGLPEAGEVDESYGTRRPTIADREITASLNKGSLEDDGKRREIEQGLGLVTAEQDTPDQDSSYLAGLDRIKQLYRLGRFEAALIETDEMVRQYQTDPKLYEMRGTLLDRVGRTDLALKSWNQALRLNPANASLRKFIERKSKAQRGVAGK